MLRCCYELPVLTDCEAVWYHTGPGDPRLIWQHDTESTGCTQRKVNLLLSAFPCYRYSQLCLSGVVSIREGEEWSVAYSERLGRASYKEQYAYYYRWDLGITHPSLLVESASSVYSNTWTFTHTSVFLTQHWPSHSGQTALPWSLRTSSMTAQITAVTGSLVNHLDVNSILSSHQVRNVNTVLSAYQSYQGWWRELPWWLTDFRNFIRQKYCY